MNGYRLYLDEDEQLRLAHIFDGSVNDLTPTAEDHARALGYYDENFNLVVPDIHSRSSIKSEKERAAIVDHLGLEFYKALPE
jgi:hypothetical protein